MRIPTCGFYPNDKYNSCQNVATIVVVLETPGIGIYSCLYCAEHAQWSRENQQEIRVNESKLVGWDTGDEMKLDTTE